MSIFEAIVLAIVEGLTEFLPVSSTGHMILAQGIMGTESNDFVRAFTVIIQLGAILSVVVLYYKRFFQIPPVAGTNSGEVLRMSEVDGNTSSFKRLLRFYLNMVIGCIPAAVLGLAFEDHIDSLLSNVHVVAIMLLLGGVFMLFIDRIFASSRGTEVKPKNAFIVGLFQCIAMIPGVSRSMATIVGGLQQKLSRKTAAEFSFFLAVPTMLGATLLKAYRLYQAHGVEIFFDNSAVLIVGNVIAFLVAMAAIKFFIGFLTRYGFKVFGWYRIVVGLVILGLLQAGVPLAIV